MGACLPACPPSAAKELSDLEHCRKTDARTKKKISASNGNDFVLNFLLMFLPYRKLNVPVHTVYGKMGLQGCGSRDACAYAKLKRYFAQKSAYIHVVLTESHRLRL